jgi:hypothetical protein
VVQASRLPGAGETPTPQIETPPENSRREIAEAADIDRPLRACCGLPCGAKAARRAKNYFLPFFFAAFFAFFFAAFLAT